MRYRPTFARSRQGKDGREREYDDMTIQTNAVHGDRRRGVAVGSQLVWSGSRYLKVTHTHSPQCVYADRTADALFLTKGFQDRFISGPQSGRGLMRSRLIQQSGIRKFRF